MIYWIILAIGAIAFVLWGIVDNISMKYDNLEIPGDTEDWS